MTPQVYVQPHIVIVGVIVLVTAIVLVMRWGYSREIAGLKQENNVKDARLNLARDEQATSSIITAKPEDEIEVTAEMIEAGAEYFYGAEPFWHRPASYEETVAALKNAYRAMRHKSGS